MSTIIHFFIRHWLSLTKKIDDSRWQFSCTWKSIFKKIVETLVNSIGFDRINSFNFSVFSNELKYVQSCLLKTLKKRFECSRGPINSARNWCLFANIWCFYKNIYENFFPQFFHRFHIICVCMWILCESINK